MIFGAVRQDSGPGYGEAVEANLQLLQYCHILINLVVTIASNITVVSVDRPTGSMRKLIPDAESFSMRPPPSFNL